MNLAFTRRTYIALKNDILATIIDDALPKGTMRVKICQLLEQISTPRIPSGLYFIKDIGCSGNP